MSSAAAVIIEDRDGRVLLLLRGPTDHWMPGRWNLPGGKIDPGESAAQAAAREAREEAGLQVSSLYLVSRLGGLDVFYAGRWSGQVRLLDGEHATHAWVPRAELPYWDVVPAQQRVLEQLSRYV